ncbi:MAG: hypothetical protein FRX49_10090 [Trebouxia sp. A1-2]|nr:MAG: hypothetical protein FRX49_10090 [Trebouxia sp. A1-2]
MDTHECLDGIFQSKLQKLHDKPNPPGLICTFRNPAQKQHRLQHIKQLSSGNCDQSFVGTWQGHIVISDAQAETQGATGHPHGALSAFLGPPPSPLPSALQAASMTAVIGNERSYRFDHYLLDAGGLPAHNIRQMIS